MEILKEIVLKDFWNK